MGLLFPRGDRGSWIVSSASVHDERSKIHVEPEVLPALLSLMPPPDLDGHRWKHRLLVVSGPAGDARVARVRAEAAKARAGFRERDLILIDIGQDPRTRARLKMPLGFSVALVGKDGGVKLLRRRPIPIKELFGTIDAMPMRQDEMRRGR